MYCSYFKNGLPQWAFGAKFGCKLLLNYYSAYENEVVLYLAVYLEINSPEYDTAGVSRLFQVLTEIGWSHVMLSIIVTHICAIIFESIKFFVQY